MTGKTKYTINEAFMELSRKMPGERLSAKEIVHYVTTLSGAKSSGIIVSKYSRGNTSLREPKVLEREGRGTYVVLGEEKKVSEKATVHKVVKRRKAVKPAEKEKIITPMDNCEFRYFATVLPRKCMFCKQWVREGVVAEVLTFDEHLMSLYFCDEECAQKYVEALRNKTRQAIELRKKILG